MRSQDPVSGQAPAFDPCFEPVMALVRGGQLESVHRAAIAVVDSRGELLGGVGDPLTTIHLRSAAKPFQALAVVESGAADAFHITSEELAIMCGSHAGESVHVQIVASLLERLGLGPEALACGVRLPLSPSACRGLEERREGPSVLHSNCSGKHAGMLAMALHLGAPVAGYWECDHPVQQQIARTIRGLLARGPGQPGRGWDVRARRSPGSLWGGVDGCGVPVVRLRLCEAAWLYASLAAGGTPELARVRDAVLARPDLVAGEELCDTKIMRAGKARVIAKIGAEGVQALAVPPTFQPDPGAEVSIGCLIKVEDGSNRPLPGLVGVFLRACDLAEAATVLEKAYPAVGRSADGRAVAENVVLLHEKDFRRRTPRFVAPEIDGEAPVIESEAHDVRVDVGRGNERDVTRFFREEWPLADEETFGRRLDWSAEPFALIVRRRKYVLGVLKGHFIGGVASIDEFVVGRRHRGRGLGSALLDRFEREALRRNCNRIVLRAVKDARAERFYGDRGYSRESIQFSYEFGFDYVKLTRKIADEPSSSGH